MSGSCFIMLGIAAAALAYPMTVKTEAKATVAEDQAIRRAFGAEWAQDEREDGHTYQFSVAHADLNGDGRPDLLIQLNENSYCGSAGCAGYALLKTTDGYAAHGVDLANYYSDVHVLKSMHKGMRDLRFDDASHVFQWNGRSYE
jgi:hypothetical protein